MRQEDNHAGPSCCISAFILFETRYALLRMRSGRFRCAKMKACSSAPHRAAAAIREKVEHRHGRNVCWVGFPRKKGKTNAEDIDYRFDRAARNRGFCAEQHEVSGFLRKTHRDTRCRTAEHRPRRVPPNTRRGTRRTPRRALAIRKARRVSRRRPARPRPKRSISRQVERPGKRCRTVSHWRAALSALLNGPEIVHRGRGLVPVEAEGRHVRMDAREAILQPLHHVGIVKLLPKRRNCGASGFGLRPVLPTA